MSNKIYYSYTCECGEIIIKEKELDHGVVDFREFLGEVFICKDCDIAWTVNGTDLNFVERMI